MTEVETRAAPTVRTGVLPRVKSALYHPVALGLYAGVASGVALHSALAGFLAFVVVGAVGHSLRSIPSHSGRSLMLDALASRGATHIGFSASDSRAIGYDAKARMLLLGRFDSGIPVVEEVYGDQVTSVSWSRPEVGAVPVMAMHNPAAVMQANAANAANHRRAIAESGLKIELAVRHLQFFAVTLDGDADRMKAWAELIEQARTGRVPVPASVQTI